MDKRVCAVCGQEYAPTAYNQRRCPACVEARRAEIDAPPPDETLSPDREENDQ